MTKDLITQFKAARRAGVPLIAIHSVDQPESIRRLSAALESNGKTPSMYVWDLVLGLRAMNEPAMNELKRNLTQYANESDPAAAASTLSMATANPVECMLLMAKLNAKDGNAVFFMQNVHRILSNEAVSQCVFNLREPFRTSKRTLAMLAPSLKSPEELAPHVFTLDEALPTPEELTGIVQSIHQSAGLDAPQDGTLTKAVDALSGLAAFPAEQATAMSITKAGLDLDGLWDRKRQMIEATPGLSVWKGGETFDDIGGCENVKRFVCKFLAGRKAPRCIVFQDEIEKMFGGTNDTSGVSQSMLGTILSEMQDQNYDGLIFLGPPGAAKSAIAKAAGNTANIPTIAYDGGALKGSLVGESEAKLRQALKVIRAVSQGRALFIATCNSIGSLPPELRRRFKLGTFFFDLPSREEREGIWDIYIKKFELDPEQARPADDGWTGAEIRQACELAYSLDCSLIETQDFIVPVAVSAAEQIRRLRLQAHKRFTSASVPGYYVFNQFDQSEADSIFGQPSQRKMEVIN